MDHHTAQQILADCLATYRDQSHADLAARLTESTQHHDHLDVIHGTAPNGSDYTIEVNLLWDDRESRHIRVMADLSSGKRGCLFGFLPHFTPEASDCFIVRPDGSFVGESKSTSE